jgi:hypothetical protein
MLSSTPASEVCPRSPAHPGALAHDRFRAALRTANGPALRAFVAAVVALVLGKVEARSPDVAPLVALIIAGVRALEQHPGARGRASLHAARVAAGHLRDAGELRGDASLALAGQLAVLALDSRARAAAVDANRYALAWATGIQPWAVADDRAAGLQLEHAALLEGFVADAAPASRSRPLAPAA